MPSLGVWVYVGCLWLQMEPVVAKSLQPIASCFSAFLNHSGMDGEALPILAPASIWPNLLRGLGGQKEKLTGSSSRHRKSQDIMSYRKTQVEKKIGGGFRHLLCLVLLLRMQPSIILPRSQSKALHGQLNPVCSEGRGVVVQPSLSLWNGGLCH